MRCCRTLFRRKHLDSLELESTPLSRVLNVFDLTTLGVGSTLGVGVYVLAGDVARNVAGPAVIVSFAIAAIASAFAGLCYAEFGARVPRAGSAYIYSYVCIGEIIAFIIGWNLILEYVIGSASVARGLSVFVDFLSNNSMHDSFLNSVPINSPYTSPFFDFFSFGVSIILAVALGLGVKFSSLVNSVFTSINLIVVAIVIIAGAIHADVTNWQLNPQETKNGSLDKGGFMPFGVYGILKGAAICFYGFVGFDCIATTGEEVKNPKRAIPISIVASLIIVFLAYFGIAAVLTLIIPYSIQDEKAPIPFAFEYIGLSGIQWTVSVGGIFGLFASLFGAMFPLPRIIYAMASDGLIYRALGRISTTFKTPMIATILGGILTGIMAGLFDLNQLVGMMSIGTLIAYTIVAACVLILRYENQEDTNATDLNEEDDKYSDEYGLISPQYLEHVNLLSLDDGRKYRRFFRQLLNFDRLSDPVKLSSRIVTVSVCLFVIIAIALSETVIQWKDGFENANAGTIILAVFLFILEIIVLIIIGRQPSCPQKLSFEVPLVPLVPALSIQVNIYLMLLLDITTWIRFLIWMAFGLPLYFLYGAWSSNMASPNCFNSKALKEIEIARSKKKGKINQAFTKEINNKVSENMIENNNITQVTKPSPSLASTTKLVTPESVKEDYQSTAPVNNQELHELDVIKIAAEEGWKSNKRLKETSLKKRAPLPMSELKKDQSIDNCGVLFPQVIIIEHDDSCSDDELIRTSIDSKLGTKYNEIFKGSIEKDHNNSKNNLFGEEDLEKKETNEENIKIEEVSPNEEFKTENEYFGEKRENNIDIKDIEINNSSDIKDTSSENEQDIPTIVITNSFETGSVISDETPNTSENDPQEELEHLNSTIDKENNFLERDSSKPSILEENEDLIEENFNNKELEIINENKNENTYNLEEVSNFSPNDEKTIPPIPPKMPDKSYSLPKTSNGIKFKEEIKDAANKLTNKTLKQKSQTLEKMTNMEDFRLVAEEIISRKKLNFQQIENEKMKDSVNDKNNININGNHSRPRKSFDNLKLINNNLSDTIEIPLDLLSGQVEYKEIDLQKQKQNFTKKLDQVLQENIISPRSSVRNPIKLVSDENSIEVKEQSLEEKQAFRNKLENILSKQKVEQNSPYPFPKTLELNKQINPKRSSLTDEKNAENVHRNNMANVLKSLIIKAETVDSPVVNGSNISIEVDH